jgi:hypothetical protein
VRRAARIAVILTEACLPALIAARCPCRNGAWPFITPVGRNDLPGSAWHRSQDPTEQMMPMPCRGMFSARAISETSCPARAR